MTEIDMEKARVMGVPEHTAGALKRYVEDRIPTGGFLYAVLTNNLAEAVLRADLENRRALADIVTFVWHYLPSEAWGSPEKVEAWLEG